MANNNVDIKISAQTTKATAEVRKLNKQIDHLTKTGSKTEKPMSACRKPVRS